MTAPQIAELHAHVDPALTERIATHAQTLIEGGAPHQQQLAQDLEALVTLVASNTEAARQLANLRASVDKALDDRDQARKERDEAKAEIERLNKHFEEQVILVMDKYDADLKKIRSEIDERVAKEHAKLGAASTKGETHADLKARAKSDHSHKEPVAPAHKAKEGKHAR
jgi:septal ring factor EnvC (AmiA/AmiB activator)